MATGVKLTCGKWSGWKDLGGIITSRPQAASYANNWIDIFARGTDSLIHHRWQDRSAWRGCESLGGIIVFERKRPWGNAGAAKRREAVFVVS